jgi:hypothetical protein
MGLLLAATLTLHRGACTGSATPSWVSTGSAGLVPIYAYGALQEAKTLDEVYLCAAATGIRFHCSCADLGAHTCGQATSLQRESHFCKWFDLE